MNCEKVKNFFLKNWKVKFTCWEAMAIVMEMSKNVMTQLAMTVWETRPHSDETTHSGVHDSSPMCSDRVGNVPNVDGIQVLVIT